MTDTPTIAELKSALADIENDIKVLTKQRNRTPMTDAITLFDSKFTKRGFFDDQILDLKKRRNDLLRQIEEAKQEVTPCS